MVMHAGHQHCIPFMHDMSRPAVIGDYDVASTLSSVRIRAKSAPSNAKVTS